VPDEKPWFLTEDPCDKFGDDHSLIDLDSYRFALLRTALRTGRTVRQVSSGGRYNKGDFTALVATVMEMFPGGHLAWCSEDEIEVDEDTPEPGIAGTGLILWPEGILRVSYNSTHHASAYGSFLGPQEEIARRERTLRDLFDDPPAPAAPKPGGAVYVLGVNCSGLHISPLGWMDDPLEPGNYTPEVLKDYQHVARDLVDPDPCGRLVLLEGPPGCGKSYLLRGLVSELGQKAYVVFLRPTALERLTDPEFASTLIEFRNGRNAPIVLMLEDADDCLRPRKRNEPMGALSTLLNITDGAFGKALDIRVLASTNRPSVRLDAALKRDMRLCRQIHIGPLSAVQARQVYARVVRDIPDAPPCPRKVSTLGQIYRLRHDLKVRQPAPEVAPVSTPPPPELGIEHSDGEPPEAVLQQLEVAAAS
jgi:hypothetical protein